MNAKILLIAFSAAAFSSCSTAYKSGQTPDDVYYSPARPIEERKDNDRYREEDARPNQYASDYYRLRMTIRDRRWRDFDDYDYSYNNSPYYYCTSYHNNYGYYYNPYYYFQPVYYPKVTPAPVNTTPRMVNLNSYRNYNNAVINNTKLGNSSNSISTRQYNNSNNGSRVGNTLRQALTPGTNNSFNNNNSTNNNTRTYTPPTNSSNSSSSPSSSGGSSSGGTPVARPGRG
jgi:hypothetical protein